MTLPFFRLNLAGNTLRLNLSLHLLNLIVHLVELIYLLRLFVLHQRLQPLDFINHSVHTVLFSLLLVDVFEFLLEAFQFYERLLRVVTVLL